MTKENIGIGDDALKHTLQNLIDAGFDLQLSCEGEELCDWTKDRAVLEDLFYETDDADLYVRMGGDVKGWFHIIWDRTEPFLLRDYNCSMEQYVAKEGK